MQILGFHISWSMQHPNTKTRISHRLGVCSILKLKLTYMFMLRIGGSMQHSNAKTDIQTTVSLRL